MGIIITLLLALSSIIDPSSNNVTSNKLSGANSCEQVVYSTSTIIDPSGGN